MNQDIPDRLNDRFEHVLGPEMLVAKQNLIIKTANGSYQLFGRYCLTESAGEVSVCLMGIEIGKFNSLQAAVSWCIAEKYKQTWLSDEISRVDQELAQRLQNHLVLSDICKRVRDTERKIIAETKSREAYLRCQYTRKQLANCVSRAKYFQIRGFNDEIARTRRTTSHKSNQSTAGKSGR